MHPTGIGPVPTPWKGAILPLNYGCAHVKFPPHSCRRCFFPILNALYTYYTWQPDVPGEAGALVPPAALIHASPLQIPSHVTPY